MSANRVEAIANAVLYEGYMLYPYRPSALKNRHRFNFGVVYPDAYCREQAAGDVSSLQTECLLLASAKTTLDVKVRFLQLVQREIHKLDSLGAGTGDDSQTYRQVERLEANGKIYQPWQEAVEREICISGCSVEQLLATPLHQAFFFAENGQTEAIYESEDHVVGLEVRRQKAIDGEIVLTVQACGPQTARSGRMVKLTVCISNVSEPGQAARASREDALMHSMVSTHSILQVSGGEFVSLIDPPEGLKDLAATCRNQGMWPVLAGEEGQHETMLASPIILYDYPQIAADSAGDLFDGTEIDEILALRILTLTDEEKKEALSADDRTRLILERTEMLPPEHFAKLHGIMRGLGASKKEAS